mmetsp:Transcript_9407/g.15349  ORF Transcript_9407/g.15349 Transcript_9407/m.15349 type:complete len:366 (-) Transcript_9407:1042-2139(-)
MLSLMDDVSQTSRTETQRDANDGFLEGRIAENGAVCNGELDGKSCIDIDQGILGPHSDDGTGVLFDIRIQLGIVISLYVIAYVFGKRANRRLVVNWLRFHIKEFRAQFRAVGIKIRDSSQFDEKHIENPIQSRLLFAENARCYRFYASGRRYCKSILVELDLRPRNDVLMFCYSLVSTWKDTISIDVPMEDTMKPFIFSLIRRVDLKYAKQTLPEVDKYTRQVPLELLPRSLWCLTDCSDLVPHFLCVSIVKALSHYEDYIELIHISDQNAYTGFGPNKTEKKALRMRFVMPPKLEDCQELLKIAFHLIDLVGTVHMSETDVESALETRKRMTSMGHKKPRTRARAASSRRKKTRIKRGRKDQPP